jgi:hypothetical protein
MLVASVDYPNKRIYLSAATANTDLDTLDIYREVRALRRTTPEHQKFRPMIIGGGNIPKIAGQTYTAAFVLLLYGCRIVPYDQKSKLRVIRDTFTDDGFAGRDCFDRTPLTNSVDIDIDFPEIEIRTVSTSGSNFSVADIWSYGARTLTSIDTSSIATAVQNILQDEFDGLTIDNNAIAAAVRAALDTELSRIDVPISSREASGGIKDANIRQINGINIHGQGSDNNPFDI